MPNMNVLSLRKKLWPIFYFFSKVGQRSRLRSQIQIYGTIRGLVKRNPHAKHESPISYGQKAIYNVKVC